MEPPGGLVALLHPGGNVPPWLSGGRISYSGISAAEERVAWCALACLFEVSRAWPAHSTTEIRGDHARAGSLPSLPFRPVPPAPGGDDDGGHNGMESLRGRAARGKHEIPTVDSETEKHNNGDPVRLLAQRGEFASNCPCRLHHQHVVTGMPPGRSRHQSLLGVMGCNHGLNLHLHHTTCTCTPRSHNGPVPEAKERPVYQQD